MIFLFGPSFIFKIIFVCPLAFGILKIRVTSDFGDILKFRTTF